MFNLQNNLANVNFNTIALWQEVTTLCEKQVPMNFYIKSWSQDNLGSRNRLFKEVLYTWYAMDSFPFIALEETPNYLPNHKWALPILEKTRIEKSMITRQEAL